MKKVFADTAYFLALLNRDDGLHDEVISEAGRILARHMPASRLMRLVAALRLGHGDYTADRKALFADETLDSLIAQARAVEASRPSRP